MRFAESLFECVAAGAWTRAVDLVQHAGPAEADDPVAARALETLVGQLEVRLEDPVLADADVERILLLGRAGRLLLTRAFESRVVEALLHRYRERPERALSIARFRPDLPAAVAVLRQFGEPPATMSDPDRNGHRVTVLEPGAVPDLGGRPLFRSAAEATLFEAALRVWPDHLVQGNVALHAALDFDRVRGLLTAEERSFFFRGLVDLVVFDPGRDFTPAAFIELDGPVHDDAVRQDRDRLKDRILSVAGYRLVRIRPSRGQGDAGAFEAMLREIEADRSAYIAGMESGSSP